MISNAKRDIVLELCIHISGFHTHKHTMNVSFLLIISTRFCNDLFQVRAVI